MQRCDNILAGIIQCTEDFGHTDVHRNSKARIWWHHDRHPLRVKLEVEVLENIYAWPSPDGRKGLNA